jgi:hypothetical protein
MQTTELASRKARFGLRSLLARFGRIFPRNHAREAVATAMRFPASPEEIWRAIRFYEDVPRRPLLFLRMFLPRPLRSEGAKTQVGGLVQCTYDGGHLVKRITGLEAPHLVRFEVLEQQLGVEDCISMAEGSYDIRAIEGGSEVVLTTCYRGHLRPRWLWRPLERWLAHRLHRHILEGMSEVVAASLRPALVAPRVTDGLVA